MPEIRSLYDALLKTHVQEDRCTNFLFWLLHKLPLLCLQEVCRESGLLLDGISNEYGFISQWPLEKSRPDGRMKLAHDKFLIVETKRFSNALDRSQFENHITGSAKEFVAAKCWFLFISGDSEEPPDFAQLRSEYGNCIGFVSWMRLLAILRGLKERLEKPYSILIDEFLIFARYYGLGKLTDMNADETKAFLAAYPTVVRYQEAATEKFSKAVLRISERVILDCEGRATAREPVKTLPCPYRELNVEGWHVPTVSIFIFLNILTRQIGLIGNGYQNQKEKEDFLPLWNEQFKQTFRGNPELHAFTWIEEGDEESGAQGFKLVTGTSGKLFDPAALDVFRDYFYWGYCYPLEIDVLDEPLLVKIASDAKKLLASFTAK